jgi:hypothetical protein
MLIATVIAAMGFIGSVRRLPRSIWRLTRERKHVAVRWVTHRPHPFPQNATAAHHSAFPRHDAIARAAWRRSFPDRRSLMPRCRPVARPGGRKTAETFLR